MSSNLLLVVVTFLLTTQPYLLNANKLRYLAETCKVTGHITGKSPESCNTQNDSECCVDGKRYNTYACSPPVTRRTPAKMTLNSFMKGADGGGKPACGRYYDDNKLVVALSTGWFNLHNSQCNKMIKIFANGRSVLAKVVDECDSMHGCDEGHAYQPPCGNNVVDASRAVWEKLGYTEDEDQWGEAKVTWSDA